MLTKERRLARNEIEVIFDKGKTFHAQHFVLKARRSHKADSRFCITFSKKLSLKAHERNTVRRRIYEAIRKNIELAPEYMDIAIIVKPSLVEQPRKTIESHVKESLVILSSGKSHPPKK